jgi:hypothetical protein
MSNHQTTGSLGNEMSLKDILLLSKNWFKYIFSKKIIIATVMIVFGIAGFFYAQVRNNVSYTANLTFALEEGQGSNSFSGALGLASTFGIDVGGGGSGSIFSGSNIIELMKSNKVISQTLLLSYDGGEETFADRYLAFNKMKEAWPENLKKINFPYSKKRNSFTVSEDSVLRMIYENIVAKDFTVGQLDKKVSFIKITYKSVDEIFARKFLLALIGEVSDFYIATKSKKSKQNVDLLQKEVDSVRNELNISITGVALATDQTFNLNPALIIKKTPSSRKQIDVQANTAMLVELIKNLQVAKMSLMKETPLIQIIDEPILPLKKEGKKRAKTAMFWALLTGVLSVLVFTLKRTVVNLSIK